MKRTSVLIAALLIAIVGACSPSHTAPAATTTSTTTSTTVAPISNSGSTTSTTVEPTTLGGSEGFQTRKPGTLVIGTERLTPPWYIGTTPVEIFAGFEYDLGSELAARLGVPTVKVVRTSMVLLMTGQDCKCDIMLSGITVTDGRARTIDLSEPYLTADQAVLMRAGTTVTNVAEASLVRWGVAVHNTTGQDVIKSRIKPTTPPLVVVNDDDAMRRIADGRLDAMLLDTPDALAAALADPRLAVTGQFRTGELLAVGLSLGSPNTALINGVIRDMRNDGTIDRLLRAYLGIEPANVPAIPP
ncbi:MAG: polar amino acid transport system substrate-binding protein [Acidimicrobiaceae bacterium]